ncbi:MAG TPA: MATE family efflux transporter [Candidatus Desulfovibrio intestinigallinarum]|nr:MATE family efflux transporter [Candidatus Desulfovibrio intestinigallinarum]
MSRSLNQAVDTPLLIRFALPTICSMLSAGLYGTVDGIFVARLVGADALAAVNIVAPLLIFGVSLGHMFGMGGSALVARTLGEGDDAAAREYFSLILYTVGLLGMAILFAGEALLEPLLGLLGSDAALLPLCRDYARPLLLFFPFLLLTLAFEIFFITAGRASLGLACTMTGGICNIVLDYLFMAVLNWGIQGAAVATGLGYALSACLGLVYFARPRDGLCLGRPSRRVAVLLTAAGNGFSEMVSNLAAAVVTLLFNNILMRMCGAEGVAAITIILYGQWLINMVFMGYAVGISPLVSYNDGSGNRSRLRAIHRRSLRLIAAFSAVTCCIAYVSAPVLTGLFSPPGTTVHTLASRGFRLFAVSFLLAGFNIYASALFTALSNGVVSALLSFCRTFLFVVPAALLLPLWLDLDGVWLSIPCAEALGLFLSLFMIWRKRGNYGYA